MIFLALSDIVTHPIFKMVAAISILKILLSLTIVSPKKSCQNVLFVKFKSCPMLNGNYSNI